MRILITSGRFLRATLWDISNGATILWLAFAQHGESKLSILGGFVTSLSNSSHFFNMLLLSIFIYLEFQQQNFEKVTLEWGYAPIWQISRL